MTHHLTAIGLLGVLFFLVVVSLQQTGTEAEPASANQACTWQWSDASVNYQSPDNLPMVYEWYSCSERVGFKRYFDLNGKEWKESALIPSARHQVNEMFEILTGQDLDINAELDEAILAYAIEAGIVQNGR
jgi:hypothetical protein